MCACAMRCKRGIPPRARSSGTDAYLGATLATARLGTMARLGTGDNFRGQRADP